jgi:hypothetical protein
MLQVNSVVEAVVNKLRRQLFDMTASGSTSEREDISVEGLAPASYLERFVWNEAKYPPRRSLKETVDNIMETIVKLEDDLKVKDLVAPQFKNQYQRDSSPNFSPGPKPMGGLEGCVLGFGWSVLAKIHSHAIGIAVQANLQSWGPYKFGAVKLSMRRGARDSSRFLFRARAGWGGIHDSHGFCKFPNKCHGNWEVGKVTVKSRPLRFHQIPLQFQGVLI